MNKKEYNNLSDNLNSDRNQEKNINRKIISNWEKINPTEFDDWNDVFIKDLIKGIPQKVKTKIYIKNNKNLVFSGMLKDIPKCIIDKTYKIKEVNLLSNQHDYIEIFLNPVSKCIPNGYRCEACDNHSFCFDGLHCNGYGCFDKATKNCAIGKTKGRFSLVG